MNPTALPCCAGPRPCAGFTLLESVLTLLLVGLLSAIAVGLFADREVFSARAVADGLVGNLLLAQQQALARGVRGPVTVELAQLADGLRVRVGQGVNPVDHLLPDTGLAVGWRDTATGSCAGGQQGLPLQIAFLADGSLLTPSGSGRSLLLCIASLAVCVTAEGHAHAGACT